MGLLTEEQLARIKDYFEMFEERGAKQSFIRGDKLKDVLRCLGYNLEDKEFQRYQLTVDRNEDGKIQFEEFVELIELIDQEIDLDQSAIDAFRCFDCDNLGYVEAKDVSEVLRMTLGTVPENDVNDLIQIFKLQPNRKISYEEFKQMIAVKENV